MTAQKPDEDIGSEGVMRFVEAAERYCSVIEGLESHSEIELLRAMDELLPLLYFRVHGLPDVELNDDEEIVRQPTEEAVEEWKEVDRLASDKLGEHNIYHEVYDPVSEKECGTQTLSDDIADVYVDLKRGLSHFGQGTDKAFREAVWQWKFDFAHHWGQHASDALRPIHSLLHNHYDEDDEVFRYD